MAEETIKTYSTESDFRDIGVRDLEITPLMFYNGNGHSINNTGSQWEFRYANGTPSYQDGIKGQSVSLNGGHAIFPSASIPASNSYMLSAWVKPTAADLQANNTWSIVATNRGHGWADAGIHIAIYNDNTISGQVNVRTFGTSGTVNLYSHSGADNAGTFTMSEDEWTHVVVLYDTNATYPTRVFFNGELSMYSGVDVNMTDGHGNSFTIGDMITGSEQSQYPINGEIDDIVYAYGENVWTSNQINDYYNKVVNGEYMDYETNSDSLVLGRANSGDYTTQPMAWQSEPIELGENGFIDYGLIQAVGTIPSGTSLTVYTRSSSDGDTWNSWQQVNSQGEIQSPNMKFIQVRVVLLSNDGIYTPTFESVEILQKTNPVMPNLRVYSDSDVELFRDREDGIHSYGIMDNAYEIIIEEEINAQDVLSFKLPKKDMKRQSLGSEPLEMVARIEDRYYIVKEMFDRRETDGTVVTEFICEARWTELREWYVSDFEVVESNPEQMLLELINDIYQETQDSSFDWSIGLIEIEKRRTVRAEWKDVLTIIQDIQSTFGGELLFDTKEKTINLLHQVGNDNGIRFEYEKNIDSFERQIDTYDLITRIYPTGKGDLGIETVNDGVPYLENREWVDKIGMRKKAIPYRWKDERYTIPQNLKEDAQATLDSMAKPVVKYTAKIQDLSALSGHRQDAFELGDSIMTDDDEIFDEPVRNRVVRRKIDVRQPENTDVELSQPQNTLENIRSRAVDEQLEEMAGTDPVSNEDIQQMTVFNNLLNSRADEGFNVDWVQTGTDIELENTGFSGDWSFKFTPDYGRENTLMQTVTGVSHRSTYTISAAVAHEGNITRGSNEDAFVGVKITVNYQDGTSEDHYLAVPDVTNNDVE